ncbi:MAG: TlpA family protein disulfide reductase [Pirellulales bacterium]|nr:TlpA family protein disulfide reductase [Pirellulales bacterium]
MIGSFVNGLNCLLLALLMLVSSSLGCGSTSRQPPLTTSAKATTKPTQPEPKLHAVLKIAAPADPPTVPPVMLSTAHALLCHLKVGETFPAVNLPRLDGSPLKLEALRGKQATVVLFWQVDHWMAHMALNDIQRDIVEQQDAEQVGVVGIAVRQRSKAVQAALKKASASFPQLLDANGKVFAAVGSVALPRVYVLDAEGKIAWFDIEYSQSTRRELGQTLAALTAE